MNQTDNAPGHTPAEAIAGNVDLITEILLRFPVKSLMRFKSVSKEWLSLISNPQFCGKHTRRNHNSGPSGLFFYKSLSNSSALEFVSLDDGNQGRVSGPSLAFLNDPPGIIKILQSCNGLLLCCSSSQLDGSESTYYICNPTTKQFTTLLHPGARANKVIFSMNLAFDSLKSPHYKVVCVWKFNVPQFDFDTPKTYEIEIYSSETGSWRSSGDPFTAQLATNFKQGVFWNGAIHWVCPRETSIYFDIDDTESLKTMTMPPMPQGFYWTERVGYFGVCCGHLHYIEVLLTHDTPQLDVLEMKRDYSGWLVKYTINLNDVCLAYPEIFQIDQDGFQYYKYRVLSVVQGEGEEKEEEEELTLVLSISDKIISYNPKDKTSKVLRNLPGDINDMLLYEWYNAYQYIETLSCV